MQIEKALVVLACAALFATGIASWAAYKSMAYPADRAEREAEELRAELHQFERCHASKAGAMFMSRAGKSIYCNWE